MSKHHELLVVAAAPADPFVEQHLAPGLVQDLSELEVLLLAELRLVRMRPPHQTSHVDAVPGQIGQDLAQSGTRAVQQLVRISPPIREEEVIAGPQSGKAGVEAFEVCGAVTRTSTRFPSVQATPPCRRSMSVAGLPRSALVRNQPSSSPIAIVVPPCEGA